MSSRDSCHGGVALTIGDLILCATGFASVFFLCFRLVIRSGRALALPVAHFSQVDTTVFAQWVAGSRSNWFRELLSRPPSRHRARVAGDGVGDDPAAVV